MNLGPLTDYHKLPPAHQGYVRRVGVTLGLMFLALSFFWRYHLSFHGVTATAGKTGLVVFIVGCIAAIAAAVSPTGFMIALPFAGAAMIAPQIPGLPFFREFGYVLAFAGAARFLMDPARIVGLATMLTCIGRQRIAQLLITYAVLGIVPVALEFSAINDLRTRTMIVHAIIDIILVVVVLLVLAASLVGASWRDLLAGIVWSTCAVVLAGALALFLPFFVDTNINEVAFFGTFYFCRLQLTFLGPVHLSTFAATMLPFLVYAAKVESSSITGRMALVCALLTPIVVFAGGSRPARVAVIAVLASLAFHRPFRRLATTLGLVSALCFGAFYEYRCVTDIVTTYAPHLLKGEFGGLLSGVTLGSDFFTDSVRNDLRGTTLKAITDMPVTGMASAEMVRFWLRVLFGYGPGISAYDVFGMTAHTSYIDLFVDRGIAGYLTVGSAAMLVLWKIARAVRCSRYERRSLAIAALLALLPLVAAAFAFDIRNWFFVWVIFSFLVVFTSYAEQSSSGPGSRDPPSATGRE